MTVSKFLDVILVYMFLFMAKSSFKFFVTVYINKTS